MAGQTAGKTVNTNKGLLHVLCSSPFALNKHFYGGFQNACGRFGSLFSSSFYVPFIPQRGLHLGADLAKIGAGLLCALQNRLYLRFLLCGQIVILCQQFRVALDDGQRRFQLVGQLNDLLPLPLLHGPLFL